MERIYDVIIIGSGPAGLTAAIYNARAELKPLLLAGREFGGQLMGTTVIENFPGFIDGIDGPVLMQNMVKQAQRFGTEIKFEQASEVEKIDDLIVVKTSSSTYKAKSLIVATGSSPRRLGLESETKFWGRGVSTCATCDGAFYKEKVVAVLGGGDSAMEEASFLTRFVRKLYIINRSDKLRASKIMQERVKSNPKIEILWNKQIEEINGELTVKSLNLKDSVTNESSTLEVDGLFLAIGHIPNTEFLKGRVNLDENGYVLADENSMTNVEGIFASGDSCDHKYRQAITAAGSGCKAAIDVEKWLEAKK